MSIQKIALLYAQEGLAGPSTTSCAERVSRFVERGLALKIHRAPIPTLDARHWSAASILSGKVGGLNKAAIELAVLDLQNGSLGQRRKTGSGSSQVPAVRNRRTTDLSQGNAMDGTFAQLGSTSCARRESGEGARSHTAALGGNWPLWAFALHRFANPKRRCDTSSFCESGVWNDRLEAEGTLRVKASESRAAHSMSRSPELGGDPRAAKLFKPRSFGDLLFGLGVPEETQKTRQS